MNPFEFFRKRTNLTQSEVAEMLGLDQTTVSRWERGRKLPRADRLPRIAAIYRCSVDDLLREKVDT